MTNAELIEAMRYCAEHEGCGYYITKDCPREDTWACGADCEQILMIDAADALEADEQRIDGLQKLVDINTERCEALRKQLREAHENYEKHLNELTTKRNQLQAAVDNYEKRIAELMPKEGEWIDEQRGRWIYAKCNLCGKVQDARSNYCPNCGAKMNRKENADADN